MNRLHITYDNLTEEVPLLSFNDLWSSLKIIWVGVEDNNRTIKDWIDQNVPASISIDYDDMEINVRNARVVKCENTDDEVMFLKIAYGTTN